MAAAGREVSIQRLKLRTNTGRVQPLGRYELFWLTVGAIPPLCPLLAEHTMRFLLVPILHRVAILSQA